MPLNISIQSNVKLPVKISYKKPLSHIAEKVVIPILQDNIDRSKSIDGDRLPKLASSTLNIKRKKGQRLKSLIATGTLRKSFKYKSKGKNELVINISSERKDIADILQNQGVRSKDAPGGRKYFNFFGINKEIENASIDYMKSYLQSIIRK